MVAGATLAIAAVAAPAVAQDAVGRRAIRFGGGITIPMSGFDTYLEGRLTFGELDYVPVVFGIRF